MKTMYTVIVNSGDIIFEGYNKSRAIKACNRQSKPSSVILSNGDILHENMAQRKINNA